MDSISLGVTLIMFLLFLRGYDFYARIKELEEESLADKERIKNLTDQVSLHTDWLFTIRGRLEIDF